MERLSPELPRLPEEGGIKKILLPVALSPGEATAIEQAVGLARWFDAKLTLLHVVDINDPAWLKYSGTADSFMQQLQAKAQADLGRLMTSLARESIQFDCFIVDGLPPEEIVKCTHEYDLLVMGHPKPQPFWRCFSKQTARRAIRGAQCPVWVVQKPQPH